LMAAQPLEGALQTFRCRPRRRLERVFAEHVEVPGAPRIWNRDDREARRVASQSRLRRRIGWSALNPEAANLAVSRLERSERPFSVGHPSGQLDDKGRPFGARTEPLARAQLREIADR